MSEDAIRVSPGRPVGDRTRSRLDADLGRLPLSLIVTVAISLLVLLAAQVDDGFSARLAWLYVTIPGAAFIVSRGLAREDR